MDLNIRMARLDDVTSLITMMRAFADYENLLDDFSVRAETLSDALFGADAFAEALLAETGGEPAGYALFFPCFASFRAQKGYFLEDLYVEAGQRGKGIGEALLREVARRGRARGFERVDFHVLEWNEPAIGFYKGLGARVDGTERHFKFTDDAFTALAR